MKKTTQLLLFFAILSSLGTFANGLVGISPTDPTNLNTADHVFGPSVANDFVPYSNSSVLEGLPLGVTTTMSKAEAPCNEYSPLISSVYSNLSVKSDTKILGGDKFSNKGRLIDDNLNNTSSYTAVIGGSAWIEVKDNTATGGNVYPAGSYAGFIINDVDLVSIGGSLKVETYLGSTKQETYTDANLISTILGSGKRRLGFATTKNFDRVRFVVNAGLTVITTVSVYYAEIVKPCTPLELECNQPTPLVQANGPGTSGHAVIIEPSRTGLGGLVSLGTLANAQNVIDPDTDAYARMAITAGVSATASLSVRDLDETFPIGHFAGFNISNGSLLAVQLLNSSRVRTYLNGVEQENVSGGSLLAIPILQGSSRYNIGFVTTKPFDEIRYTLSNVLGINLGETRVYHAMATRYCFEVNPDVAETDKETSVNIDVAANDYGVNRTSVSITSQPSNGTLAVNPATGIVSYWPNDDFIGTDTFIYEICSANNPAECDTAEVSVQVNELPCSVPINGAYFDWNYPSSNETTITQELQQPAANAGFVFDILELDNSFNMNINGTNLATEEIEFQSSGTSGINIRFQDGDTYETNTDAIWQMLGTEDNPLIRVKIAPNGDVTMFGSKVNEGPLYPLELFNQNSFNNISWNPNADNDVIVTQIVQGPTLMSGKGYGLNQTDSPVITVLNIIQPTCVDGESANNGAIEMTVTGLVDGTYNFQYDGGTLENVEVLNGEAVANNLSGGDYNNIVVGSGACQSPQGVNAVLIEPNCDSCIEIFPGGEWNQSINKAEADQLDPPVLTYDPITVAGTNAGMFFDIYKLDNSFNLTINGTPIANQEIQFDSGTPAAPSNNIRFLDDDLYRYDVPTIWQIVGTPEKPMIRVEVSPEGEVTLYGSKTSGGQLHELVLHNGAALNPVVWNQTTENQIGLSQDANGWTKLHGKVYGESICATGLYDITKTGSFDNTDPAQVGDIITYTIAVENVSEEDIIDVVVMDHLLGGELSGYVESGTSDAILNIGETWTYTEEYAITSEDIANGGVYNQAKVFGKDTNENAIPTKRSYDPVGVPGPDPERETFTYTPLNEGNICDVKIPIESQDPFYWVVKGPLNERISEEGTVAGTNSGMVFDIYRLDNSFNMKINTIDLALQEIEFQSKLTAGINVRFKDGTKYEIDTPKIYQLRGDGQNPVLRVRVAADGSVQMFGSKVSYGPLYELELINGNSFNNVTWNESSINTVEVSQLINYKTVMQGAGYGVQANCDAFTLMKTGLFNDESGDGYAQPEETISYTFTLENTGNLDIYNPVMFDDLLDGVIGGPESGDTDGNGILNIGETWIYKADYIVTEENIARKGVYNQAEVSGNDSEGLFITPVMSEDPGNTSEDPLRPKHTFVLLKAEDCINQLNVGDFNIRTYGSPFNGESTTNTEVVRASNAGYIMDIYRLDNSFTMRINELDITPDEIEFQSSQTSGINVQFVDGDKYEVDTAPIYRIVGDAANPALRLIINNDGEVSLYGSKTSQGPLSELELISGNPFNTVPWNSNADNTITISQKLNFTTVLKGASYVVIDQCDDDYIPYRPDGDQHGFNNEETFVSVKFYPNPVNTSLYVQANKSIETIEVYNLLGQMVISQSPNSKETKIDMDFLQANVYMMKVTLNGKTETYRVVKQ